MQVGGTARDLVAHAAFMLSLLTVVAGFVADGWGWAVIGLLVGVPGALLPHAARRRDWPAATTWLLLVLVVVLGLGVVTGAAGVRGA